MFCTFCRGSLKPIEVPAARAGFRCVSCGSEDTAAKMMARALQKAIRIEVGEPEHPVTRDDQADARAVEGFLKSLEIGPQT